jgi:hypothetical protein
MRQRATYAAPKPHEWRREEPLSSRQPGNRLCRVNNSAADKDELPACGA